MRHPAAPGGGWVGVAGAGEKDYCLLLGTRGTGLLSSAGRLLLGNGFSE
jgi:hypothetical protein